jgi:hypothetical protein
MSFANVRKSLSLKSSERCDGPCLSIPARRFVNVQGQEWDIVKVMSTTITAKAESGPSSLANWAFRFLTLGDAPGQQQAH